MARFVADRVRVYFGRAELMKEAQRETVPDLRESPCVVSLNHAGTAALRQNVRQPSGNGTERVFPRSRYELSGPFWADTLQGMKQACPGVAPCAVIGKGAFTTERSPVMGMGGVAHHFQNDASLFDDLDAAGIIAVSAGKWYGRFLSAAIMALPRE